MRILFVVSGNNPDSPGAVVSNQATSQEKIGHQVDFFLVKGKGLFGYLKNYFSLKKKALNGNYDIVHGHGFSALLAGLITEKPAVASLLGSEVFENPNLKKVYNHFIRKRWKATIVKSDRMMMQFSGIGADHIHVLPNGVDMDRFKPVEGEEAVKMLPEYFKKEKPIVLFMANPERRSKNADLALQAMSLVNEAELKVVYKVEPDDVPMYLNAADVVLLTSRWEGSPNIVKEAMACNRPIVATDVGDVHWLLGDIEGHYITESTPEEVAKNIRKALRFGSQTKGRQRLMELGLDDQAIAQKITNIYTGVLHA